MRNLNLLFDDTDKDVNAELKSANSSALLKNK